MAGKEPKENEVRSLPQRNALFTSSLRQWRLCIRLCSVAFNYSRDYQNCTHLPYSSTQTSREKYTLLQHPRFPMQKFALIICCFETHQRHCSKTLFLMIEKAKKLCSLGALHRNKKTIEAASLRYTSPRCAVIFLNKYKCKYKYKYILNTNHVARASIYMNISKHININISIKCLRVMFIGQSTRHRLNTSLQVAQNRMNKMYWVYLFSR